MTVATAITLNDAGDHELIHCKLWENWHGATNYAKTVEQLQDEHPLNKFVAWVITDLPSYLANTAKLHFLSPNILSVTKWVMTENGVELVKIRREDCK